MPPTMTGKWKIEFLVALFSCLGFAYSQDAVAYFNMKNVTGQIQFTANGDSTVAKISLEVSETYTWEIREFPTIPAQVDPCSDDSIGDKLIDLTSVQSVIDADTKGKEVNISASLSQDLFVRSVLLIAGEDRVCATILPMSYEVSFAQINGHAVGNVHIFSMGAQRAIYTNLMSTRSKETKEYRMMMYQGAVTVDMADSTGDVPSVEKRCMDATSMERVGEELNVPVAGAGSVNKSLNIMTVNDIFQFSSGWLKLEGDTAASCGNFHQYEQKVVKAVFNSEGVKGEIVFSQNNPYEATKLNITLKGLAATAGGYHVHEFPIGYKYKADTAVCGDPFTGGHFIPTDVTFPDLPGSTQDFAEVGDLSKKHGKLTGLEEHNKQVEDWYLPLFGLYSVVGRSVVIHKEAGSDRWVCGNIGYPGPVITAVAEFDYFAKGTISFTQEQGKPWADTSILIRMNSANETESIGHKYHIHSTPVDGDASADEKRCASTSGHWNPFGTDIAKAEIYKPGCTISDLACEVGDLSGKFNAIDLPSLKMGSKNYQYTDVNVPLTGTYTIIGKSITVHDSELGAGRFTCANIEEKMRVATKLGQWMGPSTDLPSGDTNMMSSNIEGISIVKTSLEGLNSKAGGFHIHVTPMDVNNYGDNICKTTQGHFNPYNVTVGYPTNVTFDVMEVGDISSKFGSLSEKEEYKINAEDTNLPLTGPNSIIGRSVVVHLANADRWACANIIPDVEAMGGKLIQAMATFEKNELRGFIKMSQVVSQQGASDVTIEVMLNYADDSKTTENHKWHVHENTFNGNDCGSTGGHYNPFKAQVGTVLYGECSVSKPKACEFGDLTGKFSTINVGKDNHKVFNDGFLTLVGEYSVMGRSIVIHDEDGGAGRLDCADLVPVEGSYESIQFQIAKQKGDFRDDMAAKIAEQLNVPAHTIFVQDISGIDAKCTTVQVYFTGMKASELRKSFKKDNIGDYSENDCGVSGAEKTVFSSVVLVLVVMFAQLL